MMNNVKGVELATSPKGYKLILVDGRLMMLLSNGRQLELHLENFMSFNWKANAYGKYATELNILYYSLKGKSLRDAMNPHGVSKRASFRILDGYSLCSS